jgi:hypothetical protein
MSETTIEFLPQWRAVAGDEEGGNHPMNHWLTSMFERIDPRTDEYVVSTFPTLDEAEDAINSCVFNFGEYHVLQLKTTSTEVLKVKAENR